MHTRQRILQSLLELSDRSRAGSRHELLEMVLRTAIHLAESNGAALLTEQDRVCERMTLSRDHEGAEKLTSGEAGSEFTRTLLRGGHPVMVADIGADPRATPSDRCPGVEAGPAMFVPLRQREHAPGYLAVYRHRGGARFSTDDRMWLSLLSTWTAMALENRRLSESLERLAVTDDLTQVHNYRFLRTALRREIKRAARYEQPLSVVMIDVDNLKTYNDRNGHMRGSMLLRDIARLFAENVRSFDLVAKYGGDEFTLILPQTELEGALVVAERMRAAVEDFTFQLADPGQITVSIGVSTYPEDGDDPIGLLLAADRALYRAKDKGRNRVEATRQRAA